MAQQEGVGCEKLSCTRVALQRGFVCASGQNREIWTASVVDSGNLYRLLLVITSNAGKPVRNTAAPDPNKASWG